MSKATSKPMTYGRLEEVLTNLGFTKNDGVDFVAYNNTRHNALIVLPVTRSDELLSTWHFLATRKTLMARRVTSADALDQQLKKPARQTARLA